MAKKGFTLIEILAAIVVLSAILIIAVPRVFTLLDSSKKEAFKMTNSIIRKEIIRENSLGVITPQVYTFTNGVMLPDIGITGSLPESGTIEINSEGQIQILTSNREYCAIKKFDEDTIAV